MSNINFIFLIEVNYNVKCFGKPDKNGNTHKWDFSIIPVNNCNLKFVEFVLHHTFEEPRIKFFKPPYKIQKYGFGTFDMKINMDLFEETFTETYEIVLYISPPENRIKDYFVLSSKCKPNNFKNALENGGIPVPDSESVDKIKETVRKYGPKGYPQDKFSDLYNFVKFGTTIVAARLPDERQKTDKTDRERVKTKKIRESNVINRTEETNVITAPKKLLQDTDSKKQKQNSQSTDSSNGSPNVFYDGQNKRAGQAKVAKINKNNDNNRGNQNIEINKLRKIIEKPDNASKIGKKEPYPKNSENGYENQNIFEGKAVKYKQSYKSNVQQSEKSDFKSRDSDELRNVEMSLEKSKKRKFESHCEEDNNDQKRQKVTKPEIKPQQKSNLKESEMLRTKNFVELEFLQKNNPTDERNNKKRESLKQRNDNDNVNNINKISKISKKKDLGENSDNVNVQNRFKSTDFDNKNQTMIKQKKDGTSPNTTQQNFHQKSIPALNETTLSQIKKKMLVKKDLDNRKDKAVLSDSDFENEILGKFDSPNVKNPNMNQTNNPNNNSRLISKQKLISGSKENSPARKRIVIKNDHFNRSRSPSVDISIQKSKNDSKAYRSISPLEQERYVKKSSFPLKDKQLNKQDGIYNKYPIKGIESSQGEEKKITTNYNNSSNKSISDSDFENNFHTTTHQQSTNKPKNISSQSNPQTNQSVSPLERNKLIKKITTPINMKINTKLDTVANKNIKSIFNDSDYENDSHTNTVIQSSNKPRDKNFQKNYQPNQSVSPLESNKFVKKITTPIKIKINTKLDTVSNQRNMKSTVSDSDFEKDFHTTKPVSFADKTRENNAQKKPLSNRSCSPVERRDLLSSKESISPIKKKISTKYDNILNKYSKSKEDSTNKMRENPVVSSQDKSIFNKKHVSVTGNLETNNICVERNKKNPREDDGNRDMYNNNNNRGEDSNDESMWKYKREMEISKYSTVNKHESQSNIMSRRDEEMKLKDCSVNSGVNKTIFDLKIKKKAVPIEGRGGEYLTAKINTKSVQDLQRESEKKMNKEETKALKNKPIHLKENNKSNNNFTNCLSSSEENNDFVQNKPSRSITNLKEKMEFQEEKIISINANKFSCETEVNNVYKGEVQVENNECNEIRRNSLLLMNDHCNSKATNSKPLSLTIAKQNVLSSNSLIDRSIFDDFDDDIIENSDTNELISNMKIPKKIQVTEKKIEKENHDRHNKREGSNSEVNNKFTDSRRSKDDRQRQRRRSRSRSNSRRRSRSNSKRKKGKDYRDKNYNKENRKPSKTKNESRGRSENDDRIANSYKEYKKLKVLENGSLKNRPENCDIKKNNIHPKTQDNRKIRPHDNNVNQKLSNELQNEKKMDQDSLDKSELIATYDNNTKSNNSSKIETEDSEDNKFKRTSPLACDYTDRSSLMSIDKGKISNNFVREIETHKDQNSYLYSKYNLENTKLPENINEVKNSCVNYEEEMDISDEEDVTLCEEPVQKFTQVVGKKKPNIQKKADFLSDSEDEIKSNVFANDRSLGSPNTYENNDKVKNYINYENISKEHISNDHFVTEIRNEEKTITETKEEHSEVNITIVNESVSDISIINGNDVENIKIKDHSTDEILADNSFSSNSSHKSFDILSSPEYNPYDNKIVNKISTEISSENNHCDLDTISTKLSFQERIRLKEELANIDDELFYNELHGLICESFCKLENGFTYQDESIQFDIASISDSLAYNMRNLVDNFYVKRYAPNFQDSIFI